MKKLIVKDIDGNILTQTQGEDAELAKWLEEDSFKYPQVYTVEYEDLTAEVQAIKAKEDKRKLDKDDVKKLDWSKVNTVAELKAVIRKFIEAQD